ncbi:MAG: FtsX-like permease family protein [Acidobacteria bacterium]|nr:FtsX-like permease family protein [Acidobacteriota bacterium]MBV9068170.1 FtsX-like permease family protein [Acidobacteriota bacterium]MBV9184131.1 FtsX-like permease family protein [Acidobacteriota bacterium]
MIETRIARRYLWSARKRRHTAFLSSISMLGLAVGVATLLISLALMAGLQGQIKRRLMASSPQLLIEPAGSPTIADAEAIAAAGRRLGMNSVQPLVSGIGWGANDRQRRGRPMRLRSGAAHMFQSDSDISVTRDFAAALSLDKGETITVVAPRTRLTPFGPMPVWRKYRIASIYPATSEEQPPDGYLNLGETESLFGTGGKPTSIEMYGSEDRAEEIQGQLAKQFPGVQVKTWKEINRPLFLALRLEKIVMFVTISLIIFVAALNLISSLSMLILEKRPSVGVLRTLGATERTILVIFLEVGLLIGLSGTLLGNIFGLSVSWAVNHYHLVPLPSGIYPLAYLPLTIDPSDVLGVNIVAIILSVIATWYPARMASQLDPIAAIREET